MRERDRKVDAAAIASLRELCGDIAGLAMEAARVAESVATVEVKPDHFRGVLAAVGAAWEEIEAARLALPLDLARFGS